MPKYADTLKRVMEGDFAEASLEEKQQTVRELIQVCSITSAAVAISPIPLVDTALLAPIQVGMVQGIGRVHGHRLDKRAVIEMLSTFGASIVAQNVIMAAAKFVPFFGWVVSISMAYALTYAIGEVSDHYFNSGRDVDADELKRMFDQVYKQKREEKEAEHKSNRTLKDKLEQLKEARRDGLLTEDEFNAKKEDLLKNF